jgi:hypothetical protein
MLMWIALAAVSTTPQSLHQEVVINHRRPSQITKKLEPLFATPRSDLKVKAEDEKGVITLDGPKEKVEEMAWMISAFDVQARQMDVTVDVRSPIDKFEARTRTILSNNAEWSQTTGEIGLTLKVTPRVNDDGSTTLFIDATMGLRQLHAAIRSKTDGVVAISMGPVNGYTIAATPEELDRSAWQELVTPKDSLTSDKAPLMVPLANDVRITLKAKFVPIPAAEGRKGPIDPRS